MKKKIISILCILTMLFGTASLLAVGAAASTGVSIVCSVTEQTETSATVDVSVTSNVGFGVLELTPSLPEALTLTGVTNGTLISDFTQNLQYIWVGDDDVTATGTLCTLTFAIPEGTAAGEYPISFIVRFCGNYNEEEVDVFVTPCNVTVEGASEPSIEGVDASVISYQVTKGENGEFSLRAIAGLNVLSYQNFGYEIALTTAEGTSTLSGVDTRVYSSIYGGGTQYSIKDTFGYEYAALATVTGLAIDSENTRLEIRAYVTAHNGEKVYGNGATLLYIGELDADGYPVFSSVSE